MPTVIQTDLPTILQAVEQQLLTFTSALTADPVVGSITNIYWVMPGQEPKPGTTGQRDILLALHKDTLINVQGEGRFARILSGFDCYFRTSNISDRFATRKDWFIANRTAYNSVMDALMGFFPVDGSENALTIEGLVLDETTSPSKVKDTETWGQVIGSYQFHYQPRVDVMILG